MITTCVVLSQVIHQARAKESQNTGDKDLSKKQDTQYIFNAQDA